MIVEYVGSPRYKGFAELKFLTIQSEWSHRQVGWHKFTSAKINEYCTQLLEKYGTPNRTLMLIFWYQKTIFWYQKLIFDIRKSFPDIWKSISDIRKRVNFWYQKIIFWYQKLFSDIRNYFLISEIPIFWYQKIISGRISDIRKSALKSYLAFHSMRLIRQVIHRWKKSVSITLLKTRQGTAKLCRKPQDCY